MIKEPVLGKGWEGDVKIIRKPFYSKLEGTEVLETLKYEMFKTDIKNRPIDEEKVYFFMKQFKAGKFFMKEFPIIIDHDLVILDGQHRFEAVKRLELPLYFRYAHSLTIHNVVDVQLNAGWKTPDYLHTFIQQKNMNYIILNRFIKKYQISTTVAVLLLSGESGLKKSGYYDGTFIIKDETKAHEQANAINTLGSLALGLNRDRTFCLAVAKIISHPDYEEKRMTEQLTKYTSLMIRQVTVNGYIKNLEEIYNYKLYSKNRVRFI